jgi:hypothetical protein
MKLQELLCEKEITIDLFNKKLQGNLQNIKDRFGWGITLSGDFLINNNEFTSLEGMPDNVIGTVNCSYNKLKNLKGCSLSIGKSFICKHNLIDTLLYTPKYIRGDFDISDNQLSQLKDIHKSLHTVKGKIILSNNPIKAHISDLAKISGLQEVIFTGNSKAEEAFEILNKYLVKTESHNWLGEQLQTDIEQELISKGLEEFI